MTPDRTDATTASAAAVRRQGRCLAGEVRAGRAPRRPPDAADQRCRLPRACRGQRAGPRLRHRRARRAIAACWHAGNRVRHLTGDAAPAAAADPAGNVDWVQLDPGWQVLPFGAGTLRRGGRFERAASTSTIQRPCCVNAAAYCARAASCSAPSLIRVTRSAGWSG